ncbi:hypothetical protein FIBSPDRAFT_862030, partial [Athelia psychrophila]
IGWFDLDMRYCDLGLSTQARATEELGRLEPVASPVASPSCPCPLTHYHPPLP